MDNTISSSPMNRDQEAKPVVDQLTDGQKKGLLNGGLLIGGVITGGTLHAMYDGQATSTNKGDVTAEEMETVVNIEPDMCSDVSDEMSFSEAFAKAREEVGAGGVFAWKGNIYNTYTEEEWTNMSEADQDAYAAGVQDYIPSDDVAAATMSEANEDLVDLNELIVSPELGYKDVNNDGIIDATAIDIDNDGYADAIAVDLDYDGKMDMIGKNIDDDINLDIVIVESGDGDMIDNEYLDTDSVIEMDQFDAEFEIDNTAQVEEESVIDQDLLDGAESIII